MKRVEQWAKLKVLPRIGAWLIRLLGRTMSIQTQGHEQVDELYRRGTHIIIAFWHARQLMMPLTYRGTEAHILISQHQDGEIISRIVERFGLRSVRGSSTRGGAGALRDLIRLGRSGVDLVVTPDGPKGPPQVAKLGVVQLAKATGLPIVPLSFACSKKKSSRAGIASW
ncbi:MAG: lysophospholipid acyltransferase family protein, partial [Methyloceanibacter sp.]